MYLHRARMAAREEWRLARLEWALLAPHSRRVKRPEVPELLKGE